MKIYVEHLERCLEDLDLECVSFNETAEEGYDPNTTIIVKLGGSDRLYIQTDGILDDERMETVMMIAYHTDDRIGYTQRAISTELREIEIAGIAYGYAHL